MANVNEHRLEIPVAPAAAGKPAAAMPETWLNRFVHVVASMERAGNALGTMAFTWATVVLLGGYPTVLGLNFWFATAIIFLEAFRCVCNYISPISVTLFWSGHLSQFILTHPTPVSYVICLYNPNPVGTKHNMLIEE
jgi:hypothetical protein